MYKPDLVFELKDKIVIVEFQSSYVDIHDKKRFRFYTAIYDQIVNQSNKSIEVHVLSMVEKEKVKCYKISKNARFLIYLHSLKNYDGDIFLNKMKAKIEHGESLNKKELLLLSLLCFTEIDTDIEHAINYSADTIVSIPNLEEDIGQFVKGVVLMLCDKFVKDDLLNKTIVNKIGGNMKVIEDYAQRKVDKKTEEFILSLKEDGHEIPDIARLTKVSEDFVKETLAKSTEI